MTTLHAPPPPIHKLTQKIDFFLVASMYWWLSLSCPARCGEEFDNLILTTMNNSWAAVLIAPLSKQQKARVASFQYIEVQIENN